MVIELVRKYFTWALDTTRESHLQILSAGPLFKGMGKNALRKLLVELNEKKYTAGDIIFHEGESGKAIYFVLEGSVRIIKKVNAENKTLHVLGPGSHFGELALIGNTSRFASAVAESDTLLLIMYKSYFDDLIRRNNAISTTILRNLTEILSDYIHFNQPE